MTPVREGKGDMTIAVLPVQKTAGGGHGLVVRLARSGVLYLTGFRPAQALSGFRHRVTGRSVGAQVHRARQFHDVAIALAVRYMRRLPRPGNRKPWYGC